MKNVSASRLPIQTQSIFSETNRAQFADTARYTTSLAVLSAEPPGPVQRKVNGSLPEASGVKFSEPLLGRAPCHSPLAKHSVALLADQRIVAKLPRMTAVGSAEITTTGFGDRVDDDESPLPHPAIIGIAKTNMNASNPFRIVLIGRLLFRGLAAKSNETRGVKKPR